MIAVPLNYFFVEILFIEKSTSYFLIIIFQTFINFLIAIRMTFFKKGGYTLVNFFLFFIIVLLVRMFDWSLYSILINNTDIYYIFIQVFNVVLFSIIKFLLLNKFLRG